MIVSKEIFLEYERIRKSGEYNMATDARSVAKILGISIDTYFKILRNYSELAEKYLR